MPKEIIEKNRWNTISKDVINGNTYVTFESAPAVVVLLYGRNNTVWLMPQQREESGNRLYLKTVGGYLKEEETPADGAARNLLEKVGVKISDLHRVGRVSGYGDAIKVPISPFVCLENEWEHSPAAKAKNELVQFSREKVLTLLESDSIYDDATRIQLLQWLANMR